MDNIEHLYKCYEILSDAGDKISEVSKTFIILLEILTKQPIFSILFPACF